MIPGITTIDHIADDVHQTNLRFPFEHVEEDPKRFAGAFVNSKGFGGNNATGLFLSPDTTLEMLQTRWGKDQFLAWSRKTEAVTQQALDYDAVADSRDTKLVYEFGERVITPESLEISAEEMRIPGFEQPVSLRSDNPWADMFKDQ